VPSVSLPLFGIDDPAFYRGSTARTRRTSASGAVAALSHRKQKIDTLRHLWTQPRTLQEMAAISGFALGSVCSLKKCLERELVAVDTVQKLWADGRVTSRVRWQIVGKAGR